MTREELTDELKVMQMYSCINQRYNQAMRRRWSWTDRIARILTGILAATSIVTTTVAGLGKVGIAVTIASLVAAIVLNIIAFGDWEKDYVDLFRRWTDLRNEIEQMQLEFHLTPGEPAQPLINQLIRLKTRKNTIEADEVAPWRDLLSKVQDEEEASRPVKKPGRPEETSPPPATSQTAQLTPVG